MSKYIELKKILIISPHFPPSNLAGVHRSRLFATHLPKFGWEPIIVTVDPIYYEEELDENLTLLLPSTLRIEKVNAFKITKPRLIGDIGIRAFFQLYKKAKKLIIKENIDFVYIPIPSFYCALLGRLLHQKTKVKYGIDYIDPWVHDFPGSDKFLSRHWFSKVVAKILEPIAVKKTSLITGVAEGYYKAVFERNPSLLSRVIHGAMPYGGEVRDHEELRKLHLKPYLFEKDISKVQLVYAGAMLPKAYRPLEKVFESIKSNISIFENLQLHFIGTGSIANDPNSYNIKKLAEKYGLWKHIVFEYPKRIPYLDVLIHLESASGVFILGSTEPHYTPSKVYQGVLAEKFILAILHSNSTAATVIKKANAGIVLNFDGEGDLEKIRIAFPEVYQKYAAQLSSFKKEQVDFREFDEYSAESVTKKLAKLLHQALI